MQLCAVVAVTVVIVLMAVVASLIYLALLPFIILGAIAAMVYIFISWVLMVLRGDVDDDQELIEINADEPTLEKEKENE